MALFPLPAEAIPLLGMFQEYWSYFEYLHHVLWGSRILNIEAEPRPEVE